MFVAPRDFCDITKNYGKQPVSIDGERTWYPPQACKFLKLKHHHIHSSHEKSIIIERERYNISKIELNIALMIIFHVERKIANYRAFETIAKSICTSL